MKSDDLKKWETDLKRREAEWPDKLTGLKRDIARATAEVEILSDKVASKRGVLEKLSEETDERAGYHTSLIEKTAEVEAELVELEERKTLAFEQIEQLDAAIADKQKALDTELVAYEAAARLESDERLQGVRTELAESQEALRGVSVAVSRKREELIALGQEQVKQQDTAAEFAQTVADQIDALVAQEAEAKERLAQLHTEVNRTAHDLEQLKARTAQSRKDHDNFIAYEKRAWVELNAKDKELQDRQADIESESIQLANRRSFLPKL